VKRSMIHVAVAFIATLAGGTAISQSSYPIKPIHIIISFNAGSAQDVGRRTFAAVLSTQLGQPVVIENKPGAGEMLAMQTVARAPADGYTLLGASNAVLFVRHMQADGGVDAVTDLAPISKNWSSTLVLIVRADSPAKRMEDLIALARASPGKLNYASGGVSSPPHLAGAAFQVVNGIKVAHVPYKGPADILLALLRGDADFAFTASTGAVPLVKSGKMRALAVTTATRNSELPEVPTLIEVLKNDLLVQDLWGGLWAPAKTSAEVLRKLHAATFKALTDPGVRKYIETTGGTVEPSESPEAFAAFVRRENDKWRDIVRLSGLKSR